MGIERHRGLTLLGVPACSLLLLAAREVFRSYAVEEDLNAASNPQHFVEAINLRGHDQPLLAGSDENDLEGARNYMSNALDCFCRVRCPWSRSLQRLQAWWLRRKRRVSVASEGKTCPICLQDFQQGETNLEELVICRHVCHHECIQRWRLASVQRRQDFTCPVCRAPQPEILDLEILSLPVVDLLAEDIGRFHLVMYVVLNCCLAFPLWMFLVADHLLPHELLRSQLTIAPNFFLS